MPGLQTIRPLQLGGMVEFKVELALSASAEADAGLWQPDVAGALWDTSGVWDGTEISWDDVTQLVLGATTTRGRDRFESRFKTGIMTLTLDNQSGLFAPDASTFQLDLRPGRWARISGRVPSIDATWYPMWTGQIDSMGDIYSPGARGVNSSMRCLDFFARFQIDDPPALSVPIGAGQRTDQRVATVLDAAGWPDETPLWRDLQVGIHTMPSSTLAQSRLQEMAIAADSEGGGLFIGPTGNVVFKSRDWLETDPRSITPQWSAGTVASEIAILDADTDWSTSRVFGEVRMARAGGSEVTVQDGLSISAYGKRTFRRFDFQLENDAQVSNLADRFLEAFRYDRLRIESVVLYPDTAAAALDLLTTELGDRILLQIRTPEFSYAVESWVNGITHNVTADDWTVSLRVDNADLSPPFAGGAYDELAYQDSYLIGGS